IDCSDLVDLGNGRLAVVNNRQDSLVYQVDPSGPTAAVIGLMPTGSHGTFLASQDQLLITSPSQNAVERVALAPAVSPSHALASVRVNVGVSLAGVQIIGGAAPAVGALDSVGTIHIFGQSDVDDRVLKPAPGTAWNG